MGRTKNPHAKKNHVSMVVVLLISKMSFSATVLMDGLDFIAMSLIQGMDENFKTFDIYGSSRICEPEKAFESQIFVFMLNLKHPSN